VAYLAKEYFDTECILVNHTAELEDEVMTEMVANVYPLLDDVVFREAMSARQCSSYVPGDVSDHLAADAAYVHEPAEDAARLASVAASDEYYSVWPDSAGSIDPTEEYVCVGGSSIFNRPDRPPYDPIPAFEELCERLEAEVAPVVLTACSVDADIFRPIAERLDLPLVAPRTPIQQLVDVLANAELYVGGRWHSSVLSMTGATPLITLTANTHKTQAILEQVGFEHDVFDALVLDSEIDEIVELSKELVSSADEQRLAERRDELADLARKNVRYLR